MFAPLDQPAFYTHLDEFVSLIVLFLIFLCHLNTIALFVVVKNSFRIGAEEEFVHCYSSYYIDTLRALHKR